MGVDPADAERGADLSERRTLTEVRDALDRLAPPERPLAEDAAEPEAHAAPRTEDH